MKRRIFFIFITADVHFMIVVFSQPAQRRSSVA